MHIIPLKPGLKVVKDTPLMERLLNDLGNQKLAKLLCDHILGEVTQ